MAYTKQTWTDDVSAVTGARMTHIEQGIYDNSLATDKINPSGTATTTAEIEEGQISDVIGFKSLKLKGQTSQYTTTGKNKLAIKQLTTQTINGVTFTPHYTGNKLDYVNVNGTATATAGYYLDNANVDQVSTYTNELPGGTYILDDFSGSTSSNAAIFFRYPTSSSTFTTIDSAENSRKLTMNSTFKYTSYIRINNGTTVNNMKFYPQLEVGSTQTTYEPYTNGASPNPDFPQDVNNVSGYNVIAINGSKNLFDKDINIVTPGYLNANGAVVTSDATLSYQDRFIKVQPSTAYTISSDTSTIYRIAEYTSDKTFIARTLNANASRSYTFATSSQTHFIKMAGTLTTVLNTLQIEKGNTATSYVAHQGNNFEINLGKNLIEDTFKGYNINAQGKFETGGTSADFDVQIARVMQGVTYTITPSTNVIAYFNEKPTTSSTSYNGSREVITNTNTLTPTKSCYIAIRTATTDTAQLEKGAIATPYAPYFQPIYIGKIGTYCNDIRKYNGKWYWHKEVGKVILDGVNYKASTKSGTTANIMYTTNNIPGIKPVANNGTLGNLMTSHFKNTTTDIIYSGDVIGIGQRTNEQVSIGLGLSSTLTTLELFNTWLTNNNVDVYYPLATPIDEEITYAPLLRQLDEIYNSGLYDVTNISQDNSGEAFILDFEACKNNINGIVEYIRR